jgi:epoxyqueuosine reductase
MTLTAKVRDRALALGFDLVGVAPAFPVPHVNAYRDWLARGYHGEMAYLARPDRVERRQNPAAILPGARSVVCVGLNYYPGPAPAPLADDPARGRISRYAWGIDYHDLVLPWLEELALFIAAETQASTNHRAYVDTGPILERAYGAAAGLGFVGKNTNLIHPRMGSWLFLGEVLTNAVLEPTPVESSISCGTCTRCLDTCPTGALIAPYVLDARRCISYLTIELKDPIPRDLRPLMSSWIYGCDVCQEVCPWQRFATPTGERALLGRGPDRAAPLLVDLARLDQDSFEQRYQNTSIKRIGRARLLRNVAIGLGNWGAEEAVCPLEGLLTDPEPLVRGHAAWALSRLGSRAARTTLLRAVQNEADAYVRDELRLAIGSRRLA